MYVNKTNVCNVRISTLLKTESTLVEREKTVDKFLDGILRVWID